MKLQTEVRSHDVPSFNLLVKDKLFPYWIVSVTTTTYSLIRTFRIVLYLYFKFKIYSALKHKELEMEVWGACSLVKQQGRNVSITVKKQGQKRDQLTCPVGHDLQAGGCSAPAQAV